MISQVHHFTQVKFSNFKAFREYSLSLKQFNILVGPNNSGKSTIIGGFRILAEAIRRASTRNPQQIPGVAVPTYPVALEELPIATENVFTDYDDTELAVIEFRLSNGNALILNFPEPNRCYMTCQSKGRPVRTPADFRKAFNTSIGFVPVLGPVEHNEQLYQKEAARKALLTHRASRNFRNIWYHYPEKFTEFRELVNATWPGMDINPPEILDHEDRDCLYMFCPEERVPREIYWAGFGFQVWCQMLTFIVQSRETALFIIDEPDIYLHSDLQRQLLGILKTLGPDILIATHSTEMISEADPDDLLVVNKTFKFARRIRDPRELQRIFHGLGSNLNPTLTQLAKSKRAVFVEGNDFAVISQFARKLGKNRVANRSHFAVIPAQGFNPQKVRDFAEGVKATLGSAILTGVVFDRDYRSVDEVSAIESDLKKANAYVHIHRRKEIENYLLDPSPIQRAIERRLEDRRARGIPSTHMKESAQALLDKVTDPIRHEVCGQYLAKRSAFEKTRHPQLDPATINTRVMSEFDKRWNDFAERMCIVPGKEVFASLNRYLQEKYQVSLTPTLVVDCYKPQELPQDIVKLIEDLENLCDQDAGGDMPPL